MNSNEREKLGEALKNYTTPEHPEYDETFDKEIRKLRPDWFKISVTDLLATIPNTKLTWDLQNALRERCSKGEIAAAVVQYHTSGQLTSKQIKEINDWLDSEELTMLKPA